MNKDSIIHDDTIKNFHIPRWNELPTQDLYMDQVIALIDTTLGAFFSEIGAASLTKNMVNNYVKAKIVDAPVNKKYPKLSVAMIIVVYILKNCYATDEIGKLIKLGISLEATEITYNRFCEAIENVFPMFFQAESRFATKKSRAETTNILWKTSRFPSHARFMCSALFCLNKRDSKNSEECSLRSSFF